MSSAFHPEAIPALKPTVQQNEIGTDIFLRTSSRVTEISSDTIFHRIASLVDGTRNIEEITNLLLSEGHSVHDVQAALKDFDALGLLEDRSVQLTSLPADDAARWARNLNFFGSFMPFGGDKNAPQKNISECKVTLLGLGGLGSHLLYDLAALGCQDILAVEFDSVELSNLNRQILYTKADIGRPKAVAAKERILAFNPNMKFEVYNNKIEGAEDVFAAIEGRDIAICVADRPKTEILYWVNAACVKAGIPLITGGLDTQVARYYSTQPNQGCLECWRGAVKSSDPKADAILEEQRRTQLRGDNAAFVPFVAIIGGLMVAEFSKIVTGVGGSPNAHNRTRELPFETMEIVTGEEWKKNPECACCGNPKVEAHTSTFAEA